MVSRRPAVFIYTYQPDKTMLREIRAGIEEEGVFSEVYEMPEQNVDELAYEAARDSVLGSGIGLSGSDAALQMFRLPKGKNVIKVHFPDAGTCRNLGADSARVVKKLSLRGL